RGMVRSVVTGQTSAAGPGRVCPLGPPAASPPDPSGDNQAMKRVTKPVSTTRQTTSRRWRPCLETLESRVLLSVRADFNGDGFADLAIGAPYADINGVEDAGSVTILYGSQFQLTATNYQLWTRDQIGGPGSAQPFDSFGTALATG